MNLRRANQELARLRAQRNRRDPDWSIAGPVGEARREASRRAKASSAIERAWAEVAPAELAGLAVRVRVSRGVLTVGASDAAARWQIERWLKSGGMGALARSAGVGISRVKLST